MSGYAALTRPTELVFKPTGIAEKEFIYCSFTIPEFKQSLCQLVTGTSNSHQRVKADSVLALTSVIPSSSVLDSFTSITKSIFEQIGHNRQQAQTLANLRDTLLPRLISGQLRLPEAEALLEKTCP